MVLSDKSLETEPTNKEVSAQIRLSSVNGVNKAMSSYSGVELLAPASVAVAKAPTVVPPVHAEEHAPRESEAAVVQVHSQIVDPGAPKKDNTVQHDKPEQIDQEQAEKMAKKLEQVLNGAHATQVQFRVESIRKGKNSLNFAVIDKETGKIVREFPLKNAAAIIEKQTISGPHGVLLDKIAN